MKRRRIIRKPCKSPETPNELLSQCNITDPYSKLKQQQHLDNTFKKLQQMWDGLKKHDPEYFTYDECFENLLCFLSIQLHQLGHKNILPVVLPATRDDLDRGKDQHSMSLSRGSGSGENIFTLLNDWHILNASGRFTEASNVLKDLSSIVNPMSGMKDESLKFQRRQIYKAELGHLYYELGPKYYREAAILYSGVMKFILNKEGTPKDNEEPALLNFSIELEELNRIWKSIEDSDCMKKKMILWCFQCARLQSKLLQKHNIHILRCCTGNYQDTVNTAFKNTCCLLDFVIQTNDREFSGWAWGIMAEAKKTYQLLNMTDVGVVVNRTIGECLELAMNTSPEHPHVLLLVGRHRREWASSLEQFQLAVDCLEKVVSKCESLHTANHHLGLAYRSMWILDRCYHAGKLYNNRERKAGNSRHAGRKSKNKTKWSGDHDDATHKQTNVYLRPKYPSTYESVPKHYRQPDFYDKLRTSNPVEKKQPEHKYLKKSYENLLSANEKVLGTVARYLTDLARIHVSMNKPADEYFISAAKVIDDIEESYSTDGAYLFEQWGLYMKSKDRINAKALFLKSLKFSIMGNQRSRVAFYELIDLLDKMVDGRQNDPRAVAKEKAFVFRLVGQFKQAREQIKAAVLGDVLGQPENKEFLWELITCYYGEQNYTVAADYLMMYIKCFTEKPEPDQSKIAMTIATEMILETHFRDDFQRIFRWVFSDIQCDIGEPDLQSNAADDHDSEDDCDTQLDHEYDVLLITSQNLLGENIIDTLNRCGLEIFEASDSSGDLIEFNSRSIYEAFEILCRQLDYFHVCLVCVDGLGGNELYKELFESVQREARRQDKCFITFTQTSECHGVIYLPSSATCEDILRKFTTKACDILCSANNA
ncbi:hypothetical protein LSH36_424g02034 [Paralvinella palmiformis]|uniref:Uncharacterized protein n=1 Tax=Paralvinella palmiformis TaxID=53620 RepID=A0AAD9JC22_9ANNE|nr:hypothetical protein LSH36_424g02034 [Paralvinella palmiformis]